MNKNRKQQIKKEALRAYIRRTLREAEEVDQTNSSETGLSPREKELIGHT